MKRKTLKFYLCAILLSVLTSCHNTVQTIEATRLVPYTVEVTREIPPAIVPTQTKFPTIVETQTRPLITVPAKETVIGPVQTAQSNEKIAYYNGIRIIARYYTLLDQGLYDEAYKLLSPSMPHIKTLEDYVVGAKVAFKKVQILVVQPYYEWAEQQGYSVLQDSKEKKRFLTQIIAEGEGNMSGSAMNGEVQTLFITLLLEDSEWKIYSINTSP